MPAIPQSSNPPSGAARFVLDLAPIPCPRPRVSRWGTFYPKPYAIWKKAAMELLAASGLPKFTGPVRLWLDCLCTRPKTTKLALPRGDVDNYAKAVMDAMTSAGVWDDDGQVEALHVSKRWAEPGADGRVSIFIA